MAPTVVANELNTSVHLITESGNVGDGVSKAGGRAGTVGGGAGNVGGGTGS